MTFLPWVAMLLTVKVDFGRTSGDAQSLLPGPKVHLKAIRIRGLNIPRRVAPWIMLFQQGGLKKFYVNAKQLK